MNDNKEALDWLDSYEIQERARILARTIIGPWNTGHWREETEKLERLRDIKWERATEQERGVALSEARAVLNEARERGWLA